jgi:hypothetical protein
MFSLLARTVRCARGRLPRPKPATRLGIERLEGRDCPSALQISFDYTHGANRTVNIEGSVSEDSNDPGYHSRMGGQQNLGGLTVTFSGAVTGETTTNDDGSFSVTLPAQTLGTFWGQTTDGCGNDSDYWTDDVTNSAPTIALSKIQSPTYGWYAVGNVSDEYAPGLTVTFTSPISTVNGRTATVGSDGSFYIAFSLPSGTSGGGIYAQVTDWWGATSGYASTDI